MQLPRKARALLVATLVAGSAVLAIACIKARSLPVAPLALLMAAVLLAELFQVVGDEESADPADGHTFSFSSGVHIGAILMLGPWAGALVGAFGVLAVDHLRGVQWQRIAFNGSAFAVSAAAGGAVFALAGGSPGQLELPGDFAGIAALVVAYAAINSVFVSGMVALTSGTPFSRLLADVVRAEASPKLAEAGLGASVAFFALMSPWAVVALIPLVITVYQSHARLAQLRRETAGALETFANVVDERDPSTYRHSARVARYVAELAAAVGLPTATQMRLRWAGRLHDLGKISVDSDVLRDPHALEADDWKALRRHPRLSARLLRRFRLASQEALAVEYHHERYDGRGYYGIGAEEQPLAAHFIIVADSFDAMTSDRPYRRALATEEALLEIERSAGSHFHPVIAKAFVALQRGKDPLEVISADEQLELRQLDRRRRHRRRTLEALGVGWLELSVLACISAALAFLAASQALGALLALAGASIGVALRGVGRLRARSLSASIEARLSRPKSREVLFDELVNVVGRRSDLRWAGVVDWCESDLSGSIVLERSTVSGPGEFALTSWLLREADARDDALVAAGAELGHEGEYIAVPLRTDGDASSFLVLGFGRRLPQHVAQALRTSSPNLRRALASSSHLVRAPSRGQPEALAS